MAGSVEDIYRTSDASVRASFGADEARALQYYADLVAFVSRAAPPAGPDRTTRLLDVGCGVGWSTYALAQAGYDATGIDLNPSAFEAPPREGLRLQQGSATEIPFESDSFDVVDCYQCLEHVPDPRRALEEMARVCRPSGIVAIVGPNLVSPTFGLAYLSRPSSWPELRLRRRPGMPKHPYGNTVPEIFAYAALRGGQLAAKLARRAPRFTMREPDLVPPFHADNDACYLCNPTDLIAFFRSLGFAIELRGKPGRLPLSYLLAGGTWIAARKPAAGA